MNQCLKTALPRPYIIALLLLLSSAFMNTAVASPESNKALVKKAMNELFIQRDVSAVDRYWADPYVQHNPMVPNGTKALPALVNSLPQNFRYEPGMIVADGDLVMLHGRYTGFGPEPLVVVDIFRLKDGKIVEHWDVMQKDQPASETKNGNPMFSPDEAR